MTTYEPGTVAIATVRGVPGVRVFRGDLYWWGAVPGHRSGQLWSISDITDIRPLVVLDLDEDEKSALRNRAENSFDFRFVTVQAIEQQTRPPKPPEPTGLGAVVVDSNAVTWVLAGRDLPTSTPDNWRAFDGPTVGDWQPWSRIDAARVLSEGVQP